MKSKAMLVAAMLGLLTVCGCKEPKEVSGAEFTAMLKRGPESMRSTQFIGIKDDKAILKVSEMSSLNRSKWHDTYYVTPVKDLPKDFPYPLPTPAHEQSK